MPKLPSFGPNCCHTDEVKFRSKSVERRDLQVDVPAVRPCTSIHISARCVTHIFGLQTIAHVTQQYYARSVDKHLDLVQVGSVHSAKAAPVHGNCCGKDQPNLTASGPSKRPPDRNRQQGWDAAVDRHKLQMAVSQLNKQPPLQG